MYINGIEKTWYRFAFKYIYTALTAEQAIGVQCEAIKILLGILMQFL